MSMVHYLSVKYHTPVRALRCSSRSVLRILLQIWNWCITFLCVWFTWRFFAPFLLLTPSSVQHNFCYPRLHCPAEIARMAQSSFLRVKGPAILYHAQWEMHTMMREGALIWQAMTPTWFQLSEKHTGEDLFTDSALWCTVQLHSSHIWM